MAEQDPIFQMEYQDLRRVFVTMLISGAYDFLYLPIDSATKNNVGYAFVNFKDEKSCEECMSALSGYFFRGRLGRHVKP